MQPQSDRLFQKMAEFFDEIVGGSVTLRRGPVLGTGERQIPVPDLADLGARGANKTAGLDLQRRFSESAPHPNCRLSELLTDPSTFGGGIDGNGPKERAVRVDL